MSALTTTTSTSGIAAHFGPSLVSILNKPEGSRAAPDG